MPIDFIIYSLFYFHRLKLKGIKSSLKNLEKFQMLNKNDATTNDHDDKLITESLM